MGHKEHGVAGEFPERSSDPKAPHMVSSKCQRIYKQGKKKVSYCHVYQKKVSGTFHSRSTENHKDDQNVPDKGCEKQYYVNNRKSDFSVLFHHGNVGLRRMELIYFVTAVILAKNNNKKKVLEKDTINTEI